MSHTKIALKLTVLTLAVIFVTIVAWAVLQQDIFYSSSSCFPPLSPLPTTVKLSHPPTTVKLKTDRSIRLPYKGVTRSVEEILAAPWIVEIQSYLMSLTSRHVSLCIADSTYMEAVVNWLVSALVNINPPLENVLVISLDLQLHQFLQKRGLDSVFMDPDTILKGNLKLPSKNSHIWITREVLFRLINHWEYTVATYDSDAVLIKNPQPLFTKLESSDIIGTAGTYPSDLQRQWQSPTMCMGMALFRASERIEMFWELWQDVQLSVGKFSDQMNVNNVFKQCGIKWTPMLGAKSYVHGMCQDLNLRVTLLPTSVVCRKCEKNGSYYVQHPLAAKRLETKKKAAEKGGVWFLKPGQDLNSGELKGIAWLRDLHRQL